MALFGFKKEKKKEDVAAAAVKTTTAKSAKSAKLFKPAKVNKPVKAAPSTKVAIPRVAGDSLVSSSAGVIIRPRITEKSGLLSQMGVYTFEVTRDATKATISKAVVSLYKVTPVKVAIVNLPDKKVIMRGRRGVVSGIRKAMVTVKKGEKIDFV